MHAERKTYTQVLDRLLVGFHGTSVPPDVATMLREGLSGVALYPRNFSSPAALRQLTDSLRRAASAPIVIGIDQECGTRFALPPPFTQWPSPADLGRIGDPALVEEVARAVAIELRAVGVNTDFAPMLDLNINPDSPVTKDRSFGREPAAVARLGAAFLRGLAAEGVFGCAKHFPGHGDTTMDPHLDLPVFDGTLERLRKQELVPFAAAVEARAPMIMTAHILLPQIDPNLPASLSPQALGGMLRRDMRYEGIILADDLGMGALAKRYRCGAGAVLTLDAGTDIAMLCHDESAVPVVIATLAEALDAGRFNAERWQATGARIAKLREGIAAAERSAATPAAPRPAASLDVVGCRAHTDLAKEIFARLNAL